MDGLIVYTDGGSRGNPGPGGAGAVVYRDGVELEAAALFLGDVTNNIAEYEAIILGISLAKKYIHDGELIQVRLDSELATKQLKGEYKIKQEHLKELAARVKAETMGLNVTYTHVYREQNKRADELANQAMDEGMM
jgi:ribonuclease HI